MSTQAHPPFVITGCARSGTGYTATLFEALGVPCGHEALFTPHTERFDGFGDTLGDSSWLAVPFLDQLPPGTVVFHQVRDPARVVGSLLGIRFFAEGSDAARNAASRWQVARARGLKRILRSVGTREGRARARRRRSDFVRFLRKHCPAIFEEPEEGMRAARYWVEWNRMAGRASQRDDLVYVRYRLEDHDAAQVERLLRMIGRDPDPAAVKNALSNVSRSQNTRPQKSSASSLPDFAGDAAVAELAAALGYPLVAR